MAPLRTINCPCTAVARPADGGYQKSSISAAWYWRYGRAGLPLRIGPRPANQGNGPPHRWRCLEGHEKPVKLGHEPGLKRNFLID
eukprot:1157419-Pelagomonas_calceolata.AAC.16